jgi:hypothetical protein
MKKLKDLKENECIKINTLKEAKYLAKKLRFGINKEKVSDEFIITHEFIMIENGSFYCGGGREIQLPASDFIKPKKSTKRIIKELTKRVDALEKIVVPDILTASMVQAVHNADVVMKASQPEQEEEIDWGKEGLLYFCRETQNLVMSTGVSDYDSFEGICIEGNTGKYEKHWLKEMFSLVKGKVLLKRY